MAVSKLETYFLNTLPSLFCWDPSQITSHQIKARSTAGVSRKILLTSLQKDTDVADPILNVSFSVRHKVEQNVDMFYSPQFLRERVYLQRTRLTLLSTLEVSIISPKGVNSCLLQQFVPKISWRLGLFLDLNAGFPPHLENLEKQGPTWKTWKNRGFSSKTWKNIAKPGKKF